MSKVKKIVIPISMAISMTLFSFGYAESSKKPNEPTTEDLITSLESTLPDFIKVDSLQIDVSESVGTKVKPVIKSKFTGKLLVTEDLYIDSSLISNKMVLRKLYAKESEFKLSGVTKSVFKIDKWKVNFNQINISPEPKGSPLSNFAENTFVVSGSEEEKRLIEEQQQNDNNQPKHSEEKVGTQSLLPEVRDAIE